MLQPLEVTIDAEFFLKLMDFLGALKTIESQHGRVRVGFYYFPEFLFCFSLATVLRLYMPFDFFCSYKVGLEGKSQL